PQVLTNFGIETLACCCIPVAMMRTNTLQSNARGLSATGRYARRTRTGANKMPDALDLLRTRRSVKPMDLSGPGPSAADLETILTVAARVPDHGKLAPWRFVVFEGDARLSAGAAIAAAFQADHPDANGDQVEFERRRLARAPLVIAVV